MMQRHRRYSPARPAFDCRPARHAARGFTLLELIISVALVLVLMLAITRIFSIASTTIGASQGIGAAARDARAAQAVLARDLGAMASDSPFIWIKYSAPQPAFRNAVDAAGDRDYTAGVQATSVNGRAIATQDNAKLTIDLDGNGADGEPTVFGEYIGPAANTNATRSLAVNDRSHRLDSFSFCARDNFIRQTGNSSLGGAADTLVANMTSPEAWITYGHLTLPRTDGGFVMADFTGTTPTGTNAVATDPGVGTEQNNPQNFYASQWILGRVAMLMKLPTNAPGPNTGEFIQDTSGALQQYFARTANVDWDADPTDMTPLADNISPSPSQQIGTKSRIPPTFANAGPSINTARYDLVGIDIANATKRIGFNQNVETSAPNTVLPWYSKMLSKRFLINPFINKPITASTAAQQVPAFLPACSQFVVEYAGDFVSQNDDGTLNTTAPNNGLSGDGVVDFVCQRDMTAAGNIISRRTQWFGYPRSITGQNSVSAGTGDTLLLGDFVHFISGAAHRPVITSPYTTYAQIAADNASFGGFEQFVRTTGSTTAQDIAAEKAAFPLLDQRLVVPVATSNGSRLDIFAAWGPETLNNPNTPRPKMYRITLTIDRPELAGRSAGGQNFEYVFNAP